MTGDIANWIEWLFAQDQHLVAHAGLLVIGAVSLLLAFRKPQGVVGAPPPEGFVDRGHGEFEQKAAKFRNAALAAAAWVGVYLSTKVFSLPIGVMALAIFFVVGLLWLLQRINDPQLSPWPEVTIPREAVMGAVVALVPVLAILAVAYLLF